MGTCGLAGRHVPASGPALVTTFTGFKRRQNKREQARHARRASLPSWPRGRTFLHTSCAPQSVQVGDTQPDPLPRTLPSFLAAPRSMGTVGGVTSLAGTTAPCPTSSRNTSLQHRESSAGVSVRCVRTSEQAGQAWKGHCRSGSTCRSGLRERKRNRRVATGKGEPHPLPAAGPGRLR